MLTPPSVAHGTSCHRPSQCLSYANMAAMPTTPRTTRSSNAARSVPAVPSWLMVRIMAGPAARRSRRRRRDPGCISQARRGAWQTRCRTGHHRVWNSSTSCAHCPAFEMPAASNAASSSSSLALFADSFPARASGLDCVPETAVGVTVSPESNPEPQATVITDNISTTDMATYPAILRAVVSQEAVVAAYPMPGSIACKPRGNRPGPRAPALGSANGSSACFRRTP